jgi:predicted DNA-binding transcriptional regulator AlpA
MKRKETIRMNLDNTTRQRPVRLLGWDDLTARGIKDSKPTIYRKIKAGKFPKPVYPGKSPAWPEHEIDAHILSLIAQRDASSSGAM